MSEGQESRLTQSFLGLDDESFRAVPILEKALVEILNRHIDVHHITLGTVVTALACVTGEYISMTGNESASTKQKFLEILDAYVSAGIAGARLGPDSEPSLVRRFVPGLGGQRD